MSETAANPFAPLFVGGLGLNSGLADVHNLAFKLAAVCQGTAKDSCLDSYETDRRHVATVNSSQSVKNGKLIFGFLKTLGTAGTSDVVEARRNLHSSLTDPKQKQKVDMGVEAQREHFDNLGLHIGYVYGDTQIPKNASAYTPRFVAGARLPHAWLRGNLPADLPQLKPVNLGYVKEMPLAEVKEKRYSTLDLCAPDTWTFILGPDSSSLEKSARSIACRFAKVKFKVLTVGGDFDLLPDAAGQRWLQQSGLKARHGMLIQPDQHIFCMLDATEDQGFTEQALSTILIATKG